MADPVLLIHGAWQGRWVWDRLVPLLQAAGLKTHPVDLPGNGADHRFVEVDMLDFDIGDLDAPGVGLRVEHLLDVIVELFTLGQHVVQIMFAKHRAQRR